MYKFIHLKIHINHQDIFTFVQSIDEILHYYSFTSSTILTSLHHSSLTYTVYEYVCVHRRTQTHTHTLFLTRLD